MCVTFLSLFSFKEVSTEGLDIPHLDKLVHFTFYFVFTIFGSLSYLEYKDVKIDFKKVALRFCFLAIGYGMIIEILQYVVTTTRNADFLDFLANSFGAICGFIAVKTYYSKRVAQK
ncbi:VanZ family protein [Cellulophaga sp. L1A9]|uniref:VanZ family protein n=1 Tax=Cellulophaga sp. L1A9 TaxID=2686362 RepID=UPI00131DC007|nr:VanZ family protein [Cellulophaga sp. L1A9]